MVMHLPLYMYRRFAEPGGTRLSKFVPYLAAPKQRSWLTISKPCEICGKQVEVKKINGRDSLDGHFRGNNYYHNECFASLPGGWRVDEKSKPSKGNLDNADYRFWIGTRYAASASTSWGMCRCCRFCTHSDRERVKHLNDDSCAVGGDRCSARLIHAYRELLTSSLCLICKNPRYGRMTWGVPLCSKTCEQEWMFSHDRHIRLEALLMAQKKKAEFMERQTKPIGEWCSTCKMRSDTEGHEYIHAQWESMGMVD